jgi:putative ABC transport system permease protein
MSAMIKNYILTAWRNLFRNRVTSVINILGLTIGLTCFTLIALYVQYEMSYDHQHEKAERIYRVAQQQVGNFFRGADRFTGTPSVLAPTLRNEFPEVQAATTIQLYQLSLEGNGKVFLEQGLFSDEFALDVFTYPMVAGVGREALQDPNSIILTHSLARKYFGDEDAIGKTLLMQERQVTVKGIIADVPKNQHFTFEFITSFRNLPFYEENRWNSNNFITYVVLPSEYDAKEFESKLVALDKYTLSSYAGLPFKPKFFLQPLRDIHLHSQINFELDANGDMNKVWLFTSIAFIILLLASINYMNLATARSILRGKEVGMRKVLGAQKWQLVYQFMGESFLLTMISFVLAMAIVNLLLPTFNQLLGEEITLSSSGAPWLFIGLLVIAVLIGILSGLYPAMFLSAMAPIRAIKGILLKNDKGGSGLRNILVVAQFSASIVLATGSIVIYQQLAFIQNKKLGYNRDRIVYIQLSNIDLEDKLSTIRTELLKNPQLERVSFMSEMPLNMGSQGIENKWEGNISKRDLYIYRNYVDYDFIDLFEIELLEGRNFSPSHPTDSVSSYILNETAVKALGWKSAVGKEFRDGHVIGVVKDYHFQPFDLTIQPMYTRLRSKANRNQIDIAMKIKMDEPANTLKYIHETVKAFVPHTPIESRFMDSDYDLLYQSESRFGQAFNIFTILALFIACMGMFGLVSHHVFQRTKEIGIRKILGATVSNIVGLVSKDFFKLVLVSIIIASPIAFWIMNKWLQNFAYKIAIEWWTLLLSGLVAASMAVLTISIKSIKAALTNPVKSLRSE